MSRAIVNRSDALRARALHRKARNIAEQLAGLHEQKTTSSPQRDRARDLAASASLLLNMDRTECERVVQRLEDTLKCVKDDLRPLSVAQVGAGDANALAYAEARLLARMTEPMSMVLCEVAGVNIRHEQLVREAVAPVLRGASASVRGLEAMGELRTWRVVRACAMAAHDRLTAAYNEAMQEDRVHPRWLRLMALREVLCDVSCDVLR